MNSSIYIFDAGSTKTDLLIYSKNEFSHQKLSGYNPNRNDTYFSDELSTLSVPLNAQVFFYGSGVGNTINQQKVKNLFPKHNITIESDLLGAARSTLSKNKGIICILGTGGISAYYDGNKIIEKKGGYGYLIDDLGGGLELGKLIVSNWLNGIFNANTNSHIQEYFNCTPKDFTSQFYKTKDLHLISGLCTIIPKLIDIDIILQKSIITYFRLFFQRHVNLLTVKYNENIVNLVGSVAHHFYPLIKESTLEMNLKINPPIKKPIQNLLKFHLLEKE